ncbi:MAG: NAD-dependent epimerase/dehydratase family protein [bacterium]|nr:NAD-dependent epimerase/dehydratase family protein [bacterium]
MHHSTGMGWLLVSLMAIGVLPCQAEEYALVRLDTMVAMEDGVQLNTTVFTPDAPIPTGGWPAIIYIHGLGGSKAIRPTEALAQHGYATLAYTVRGQGRGRNGAPSEGVSTVWGPREVKDLKAMIAWFKSSQPVHPDRVGITGRSQGGIHSWMAVAHNLGVAAAVPQNFTAGSIATINRSIHKNMVGIFRARFVDSTLAAKGRHRILGYSYDGLKRDFSKDRDLHSRLKNKDVPTMIHFAWEDGWGVPNNVIRDFQLLKGPKKLYLGTGGNGSASVRSEAQFRDAWTQRWFDRWLKGQKNSIEKEPPVEIALLDSWEHFQMSDFPPPKVKKKFFFISHSDEAMLADDVSTQPDSLTLQHAFNKDFTLTDLYQAGAPLRGENGVLTHFSFASQIYESDELASDMLLVGIPRVSLFVGGEALFYQINLRLWDLDPETNRQRLISRMTYLVERENHKPGDPIIVEMAAVGYRAQAGHLIRLEISNLDMDWHTEKQDWRRLWALPLFEPGDITFYTGPQKPANLELPVYSPSKVKSMNILIIGGTRYMGRIAVQNLLDRGDHVTVFSRGNTRPEWWDRITHIPGDHTDAESFTSQLKGKTFDAVLDTQAFKKEDVELAHQTFEGHVGRYLMVSTGSVYLDNKLDFATHCPFKESDVDWSNLDYTYPEGEDPYGVGKRHCEKWLQENSTLPYTVVRIPAIMGWDDPTGRMWWWIQRALDGKGVVLPLEHHAPFRTLYSGDAAENFVRAIDAPEAANQIYHNAMEEVLTPKRWVDLIWQAAGHEPDITYIPNDILQKELEAYSPPLCRPIPYIHDLSRAKQDFSFSTTPVEEWVHTTVAWYRDQYEGQDAKGYQNRSRELELANKWTQSFQNLISDFQSS